MTPTLPFLQMLTHPCQIQIKALMPPQGGGRQGANISSNLPQLVRVKVESHSLSISCILCHQVQEVNDSSNQQTMIWLRLTTHPVLHPSEEIIKPLGL